MNTKILITITAIFALLIIIWLGVLTLKVYKSENAAEMTETPSTIITTDVQEINKAQIGGKFSYDKADAFIGKLIASLNNGKVLIVYGSVKLNSSVLKDAAGITIPKEIKYIYINNETQVFDSDSKSMDVNNLGINDMLLIKTKDSTDLGIMNFDATTIIQLKKTKSDKN